MVKWAEKRDGVGDLLRKRLSKQTITSRGGVGGQARLEAYHKARAWDPSDVKS